MTIPALYINGEFAGDKYGSLILWRVIFIRVSLPHPKFIEIQSEFLDLYVIFVYNLIKFGHIYIYLCYYHCSPSNKNNNHLQFPCISLWVYLFGVRTLNMRSTHLNFSVHNTLLLTMATILSSGSMSSMFYYRSLELTNLV